MADASFAGVETIPEPQNDVNEPAGEGEDVKPLPTQEAIEEKKTRSPFSPRNARSSPSPRSLAKYAIPPLQAASSMAQSATQALREMITPSLRRPSDPNKSPSPTKGSPLNPAKQKATPPKAPQPVLPPAPKPAVRQRRQGFSKTQDDTPEEKQDDAFLRACKDGDKDAVAHLVATGQEINVADAEGNTAVSLTCAHEDSALLELLLAHRPLPEIMWPNKQGEVAMK